VTGSLKNDTAIADGGASFNDGDKPLFKTNEDITINAGDIYTFDADHDNMTNTINLVGATEAGGVGATIDFASGLQSSIFSATLNVVGIGNVINNTMGGMQLSNITGGGDLWINSIGTSHSQVYGDVTLNELTITGPYFWFGSGIYSTNKLDVKTVNIISGGRFLFKHAAMDMSGTTFNLSSGTLSFYTKNLVGTSTIKEIHTSASSATITFYFNNVVDILTLSGTTNLKINSLAGNDFSVLNFENVEISNGTLSI